MPGVKTDIWGKIVGASWHDLPAQTARCLLELQFSEADRKRISALSERANEGKLTELQRAELEQFLDAASLLGIIHSHARRAIRRGDAAQRRRVS